MVGVIIASGGRSSRMKGVNKITVCLCGIPVVVRSILAFEGIESVTQIVVVAGEDDIDCIKEMIVQYGITKVKAVVKGGDNRTQSVMNGFYALDSCEYVAIHDGARPLVTADDINKTIANAVKYKATALASRVTDTIKSVELDTGRIDKTIPRDNLVAVQTPQIFEYKLYKQGIERAVAEGKEFTDDCQLIENVSHPVYVTIGDKGNSNIKLTTKEDIAVATGILGKSTKEGTMRYRVGHGYDVHRLVSSRDLILGGVLIPFDLGLLGHSDADVVIHAIMDSLLGACGLGDIGKHFPDTDPTYKGISSMLLLKRVVEIISNEGYSISNIDCTVIAQKPKISPYIEAMRDNIANTCNLLVQEVNIKATTEEGLGFSGRLEGISAHSVAIVYSSSDVK